MKTTDNSPITVQNLINVTVEKAWTFWTEPEHIIRWNNASEDWFTPYAENDLKVGGKFFSRMEARDGSMGFDFTGTYTKIERFKLIETLLDDGRKTRVEFKPVGEKTQVIESFDPEQVNSLELQRTGWQSILDNYKKYAEGYGKTEILHFEVSIDSNVSTVYQTMIDPGKYKEWTSVFNPTSHFKGSWKKGSKMLFIGTDKDGKTGGMVSKIRENIPNKYISIEHVGLYKDGKEITSGPEAGQWSGALENYTFKSVNNKAVLAVDIDTNQEFKSYFYEMWPQALKRIKEICE